MSDEIRIGIIICDRYRACAGGKCLRALNNREGAFSIYDGKEVKLVGYTACGGCGTHPIPQNYYETHTALGTWNSPRWTEIIQPTLADEETRLLYD